MTHAISPAAGARAHRLHTTSKVNCSTAANTARHNRDLYRRMHARGAPLATLIISIISTLAPNFPQVVSRHEQLSRACHLLRRNGSRGTVTFPPLQFHRKKSCLNLSSQTRSRQKRMAVPRSSLSLLGGAQAAARSPPRSWRVARGSPWCLRRVPPVAYRSRGTRGELLANTRSR